MTTSLHFDFIPATMATGDSFCTLTMKGRHIYTEGTGHGAVMDPVHICVDVIVAPFMHHVVIFRSISN
jgi:hypothetical protein